MKRDLKKIVSQMTLEEKAGMCSGLDFWHLKHVERLGIPEVMVSDGPCISPAGRPSNPRFSAWKWGRARRLAHPSG